MKSGSFGLGSSPLAQPKRRAAFASSPTPGSGGSNDVRAESSSSSDGTRGASFDYGLLVLLAVAVIYLGCYFTLFGFRAVEVSAFTDEDDPSR